MKNPISIKDRLRNQARESNTLFQDKLVTYGLERTIYRISKSNYSDKFTLKGGLFLFALFDGSYARSTVDMDLLAQRIPNDIANMKKIFEEIFSLVFDDGLKFDLNTLEVEKITEFKEYHGINIKIKSLLDKTVIPLSIDIGFGDSVYPDRVKMEFPVLLDDEPPIIYAYSVYSVIAEKFEAIVSLGLANSRLKDFYDIYMLSISYDLNGELLRNSIKDTFTSRGTTFDNIIVFNSSFYDDKLRIERWNSFIKKKKAINKVELPTVMKTLNTLFVPIIDANIKNIAFDRKWTKEFRQWMQN